jgi:hemoglobin-like flavoprotein
VNAAQITLVRTSFDSVRPVATQAAAMFYDRLFERQPDVAPLFRSNMAQQGERLMGMIAAAVDLLDQPQRLQPALAELGRRHVGYGVQAAHYDAVGHALLDTLAAALGAAFTPSHRAAWAALYQHVSHTMQAAATAPAEAG